jgi:hypothetical protein
MIRPVFEVPQHRAKGLEIRVHVGQERPAHARAYASAAIGADVRREPANPVRWRNRRVMAQATGIPALPKARKARMMLRPPMTQASAVCMPRSRCKSRSGERQGRSSA